MATLEGHVFAHQEDQLTNICELIEGNLQLEETIILVDHFVTDKKTEEGSVAPKVSSTVLAIKLDSAFSSKISPTSEVNLLIVSR